ncbi:MAG: hypothetical protein P1U76_16160, partial [Thalassolituus oleivorans]
IKDSKTLAPGLTPLVAVSVCLSAMRLLQSEPEGVDHLTNLLVVQSGNTRSGKNNQIKRRNIVLVSTK